MTQIPSEIPRLVMAGTASGVGKTTVMVGLIRALRRRGLKVATFKCGPDYLDPTYHAKAAGGTSHNLDGWIMGRDAVVQTFTRACRDADLALIEGVMGLYDGASPTGEAGSSAEIAKWLKAPVLLLIDASGMARSVAAVALGFRSFDPALDLAGVIANRVGSRSHLTLLGRALGEGQLVGGLPVADALAFAERHLGLCSARHGGAPDAQLDGWADLVEDWFDLDRLLAIARGAPALEPVAGPTAAPQAPAACRIGLALDEAFDFYYEDNLERLRAAGAELVPFSPLHDRELPDVSGLLLGGGYPELHAAALAANDGMRTAIRSFGDQGGPIYAECGGLIYLSESLHTKDGASHAMVGLVPGTVVMHDNLVALGYVEVETQVATPLGGPGLRFRGHQFRYSDLTLPASGGAPTAYHARRRRDDKAFAEGYLRQNVLASYIHAHWASNPMAATGFVKSCQRYQARGPEGRCT